MGIEDNRRFAVNEVEYVQRVALEMRKRPNWVAEIDDTPSRLPVMAGGVVSSASRRAEPVAVGVASAPRSVALQADWRIGFKQVSNVYRRQYR